MPASKEPVEHRQEGLGPDTAEKLEINETQPGSASEGEGPEAGGATEAPEEDLASLLAEAQEKVGQYYEELLRAKAEVENIRRRAQDDVAKARKFGTETFAESLIPVKDSLEAALALTDQTAQAWQEGVEATLRQLNSAFERNLMKEIAPVQGDKFDPHLHQAISSVPSGQPEGEVIQLLQKGYTIAERVLRPALVTVSSGQA